MILDFALFGAGILLLVAGAELLVRAASAVAGALRAPVFLVGVLVVGAGTSLPELAVSVDAAIVGAGDVAVGNVIGSNLCNGALILGLAAFLRPLPLAQRLWRWQLPVLVLASAAVAVFLRDSELARGEAALLLTALTVYVVVTLRGAGATLDGAETHEEGPTPPATRLALTSAAGLGGLVVGAKWLVEGATLIARDLGVSDAVIAISLVAVGTNLPELATTLVAVRHRASELVAGSIIGSNLFNTMAVLGLSGLTVPLQTVDIRTWELAVFVAAPLAIGIPAARGHLGRSAGVALVVGYGVVLAALAHGV